MRSTKNANPPATPLKKWLLAFGWIAAFLVYGTDLLAQSSSEFVVRPSDNGSCGTGNVPVEFHEGLALAKLSINGHPVSFIIDSAGTTMVNSDRLLLPLVQQIHTGIVTASSTEPLQVWNVVRISSLKIGSAEVRDPTVLSRSMRSLEAKLGRELDGILGTDVLSLWDSLSLNHKAKTLALDGATCIHTKSSESLAQLHYDTLPIGIGKAWR